MYSVSHFDNHTRFSSVILSYYLTNTFVLSVIINSIC